LEPAPLLLSRSLKTVVLGCALLSPVFLGGCDRQSGENAQPQPSQSANETLRGVIDRSHAGTPLPDFTLTDSQGGKLELQSLTGKPVLINLWATWCAPCVVELPMLDSIAADSASELKVLTVSQDMQPDKVAGFLSERGLDRLEPWLDPDNDLSFHYGTGTLPTTILYDADGREVWRFIGAHDWTSSESAEMLAEGK
jgi:thiol-disulfide isomerase/thioredoxin